MNKSFDRYFLLAGFIGVVFYLLHVLIGGILWQGYNHLQQPISDLTGSGAPNRSILLVLTTAYGLCCLFFAVNLIVYSKRHFNSTVLIGAIIFFSMHLVSFFYNFFPEDMISSKPTFSGTMHIVLTIAIIPLSISAPVVMGIGFKRLSTMAHLGIYSIISCILIFIFGGTTAIFYANKLPFFGLAERVNIGVLQMWTAVISITLFRMYDVIKTT